MTFRTGLLLDPECLLHDPGPQHPESPARLSVLIELVQSKAVRALPLLRVDHRNASEAEVLRVHTPALLERLKTSVGHTIQLDQDTIASPRSFDCAMRAAGAAVAAVDAVMAGTVDNAMVLVRPPGHHAEADRPMGFCLLNNVAIAAQHARVVHGLARVAIVDFDVHHGNGTQAIFERDPNVLYISTHQWPLFPGTGAADSLGSGPGLGRTINIPLGPEHGDAEYDAIYGGLIARILDQFRPDLILLSAGYDISEHDPLGGMSVTYAGFARIAGHMVNAAELLCKKRLVAVLEGGYSAVGLTTGVQATLEALTGTVRVDDPRGPLVRLPLGDAARHLHLYREYFAI
jgi:acetoin utilization deacetylase AcuC-like enzyme